MVLLVSLLSSGVGLGIIHLGWGALLFIAGHIYGAGGNSLSHDHFVFSCVFPFFSGAGAAWLVRGKFGSSLSKPGTHDLLDRCLSSLFFFSNLLVLPSYDFTYSLSPLLFGSIPVLL